MGRSQETFNKKEVRNKKEKKRKDKEAKKLAKKELEKKSSLEDMMAYVDENGNITDTPPDPNKRKVISLESIEISVPKTEASEEDPIRRGTVTFFNDSKGYGFIKDSITHESVFVHANNLVEDIKENNIVEYEVEMGQKGPTAVNVKVYRAPAPVKKDPAAEKAAKSESKDSKDVVTSPEDKATTSEDSETASEDIETASEEPETKADSDEKSEE